MWVNFHHHRPSPLVKHYSYMFYQRYCFTTVDQLFLGCNVSALLTLLASGVEKYFRIQGRPCRKFAKFLTTSSRFYRHLIPYLSCTYPNCEFFVISDHVFSHTKLGVNEIYLLFGNRIAPKHLQHLLLIYKNHFSKFPILLVVSLIIFHFFLWQTWKKS